MLELIRQMPQKEMNGRTLIQVSLKQLLSFILKEGHDMQQARLSAKITSSGVRTQDAPFQPQFSMGFSQAKSPSILSTNLSGAGSGSRLSLLSTSSTVMSAGVNQKTTSGVSYSLTWQTIRSQSEQLGISEEDGSSVSNGALDDPLTTHAWTAGVNIPLMQDFGEVNQLPLMKTETAYKQQLESIQMTELQYINQIGSVFWDMVGVYANIGVLESDVQLAKDFVRENREKRALGVIDDLSLEQSLSQLALAEQRLLSERLRVREVEDLVKTTLSLEGVPYGLYPLDKPEVRKIEIPEEKLKEFVLKEHPAMKQLALEWKQQRYQQLEAENLDRPNVDLSLEYTLNGYGKDQSEAASRYSDANLNGYAMNLSWNVPWGDIQSKEKMIQAKLAANQLKLKEKNVRSQLLIQLGSYFRKLDLNEKEVGAAATTSTLMKNILDKENEKFDLGLSSSYKVTQAQKDYSSAQRNEILAQINYQKSLLGLLVLTGQVWDYYQLPQGENL